MSALLLSMDVEASGPCPGLGDMISFAAVVIEPGLTRSFYSGNMQPESPQFEPAAYASIGMTRREHCAAEKTLEEGVVEFVQWLQQLDPTATRHIMVSDNPGFDFGWVNYYLHHKIGKGWLGHSARRIGDVWAGLRKRPRETQSWRRYRVTPHNHNPLNDATANAEAWLTIWEKYG